MKHVHWIMGLVLVVMFASFSIGLITGYEIGGAEGEISILNGTAQYRLETQADNTVDWIEVEPYQVRCEPVE